MRGLGNLIKVGACVAAVAGVTLTATSASAFIVCNRWHDCWRVSERVEYPSNLGIVWYPDEWTGYSAPHYHYWDNVPAERGYYYHGHWRRWR